MKSKSDSVNGLRQYWIFAFLFPKAHTCEGIMIGLSIKDAFRWWNFDFPDTYIVCNIRYTYISLNVEFELLRYQRFPFNKLEV